MYKLIDTDTSAEIGTISEAQLAFLVAQLEEESAADRDYYIASVTVDIMESRGADAALITLLRGAMGSDDGVEVRWTPA